MLMSLGKALCLNHLPSKPPSLVGESGSTFTISAKDTHISPDPSLFLAMAYAAFDLRNTVSKKQE